MSLEKRSQLDSNPHAVVQCNYLDRIGHCRNTRTVTEEPGLVRRSKEVSKETPSDVTKNSRRSKSDKRTPLTETEEEIQLMEKVTKNAMVGRRNEPLGRTDEGARKSAI